MKVEVECNYCGHKQTKFVWTDDEGAMDLRCDKCKEKKLLRVKKLSEEKIDYYGKD